MTGLSKELLRSTAKTIYNSEDAKTRRIRQLEEELQRLREEISLLRSEGNQSQLEQEVENLREEINHLQAEHDQERESWMIEKGKLESRAEVMYLRGKKDGFECILGLHHGGK